MALKTGEVVEGRVVEIDRTGVWVTAQGERLFVALSEISWYEIEHPSEHLEKGEWVRVKVLGRTAAGVTECSLRELEPEGGPDPSLDVEVLVHTPRGSLAAFDFDTVEKRPRLRFVMRFPHHFPAEYGSVEKTLSERGDFLPAFLLVSRPTLPGCVAAGRVIGYLQTREDGERGEFLLAVATGDPRYRRVHSLSGATFHKLREIEHFVRAFGEAAGRTVRAEDWKNADEARTLLAAARERWTSRTP